MVLLSHKPTTRFFLLRYTRKKLLKRTCLNIGSLQKMPLLCDEGERGGGGAGCH